MTEKTNPASPYLAPQGRAQGAPIAPYVVQNYINNNVQKSQLDEFIENNNAWSDLLEMSNSIFEFITSGARSVASFFAKPGIEPFVPAEEFAKTQAAVVSITDTVCQIVPVWEKLRAQHDSKQGRFTEDDNYETIVTLGSEYTNISDHFEGLTRDLFSYLYGVMHTTEMNLKAAEAAAGVQPVEEAAPTEESKAD